MISLTLIVVSACLISPCVSFPYNQTHFSSHEFQHQNPNMPASSPQYTQQLSASHHLTDNSNLQFVENSQPQSHLLPNQWPHPYQNNPTVVHQSSQNSKTEQPLLNGYKYPTPALLATPVSLTKESPEPKLFFDHPKLKEEVVYGKQTSSAPQIDVHAVLAENQKLLAKIASFNNQQHFLLSKLEEENLQSQKSNPNLKKLKFPKHTFDYQKLQNQKVIPQGKKITRPIVVYDEQSIPEVNRGPSFSEQQKGQKDQVSWTHKPNQQKTKEDIRSQDYQSNKPSWPHYPPIQDYTEVMKEVGAPQLSTQKPIKWLHFETYTPDAALTQQHPDQQNQIQYNHYITTGSGQETQPQAWQEWYNQPFYIASTPAQQPNSNKPHQQYENNSTHTSEWPKQETPIYPPISQKVRQQEPYENQQAQQYYSHPPQEIQLSQEYQQAAQYQQQAPQIIQTVNQVQQEYQQVNLPTTPELPATHQVSQEHYQGPQQLSQPKPSLQSYLEQQQSIYQLAEHNLQHKPASSIGKHQEQEQWVLKKSPTELMASKFSTYQVSQEYNQSPQQLSKTKPSLQSYREQQQPLLQLADQNLNHQPGSGIGKTHEQEQWVFTKSPTEPNKLIMQSNYQRSVVVDTTPKGFESSKNTSGQLVQLVSLKHNDDPNTHFGESVQYEF